MPDAWDDWAKPLEPTVRKTAAALRKAIVAAFPAAEESLKTSAKMRYAQYKLNGTLVCMLTPEPTHAKLMVAGVPKGVPGLLVEGTGKGMRHVKFYSASDIDAKAVAALLRQVART